MRYGWGSKCNISKRLQTKGHCSKCEGTKALRAACVPLLPEGKPGDKPGGGDGGGGDGKGKGPAANVAAMQQSGQTGMSY